MTTTHPPPAPPAPSAAPTRDRLQLEPPPRLEHAEGAGGVLMNAIPMLGSLGSIALVATMGGNGAGGRQYLAAGMFLLATLGFVAVQIDRQRARRGQQVSGARTDYLRYLGTVRRHAREAADEQRRALTWRHPEPASLPAIAEDGTRIWERASADPDFLHVRYAVCDQPLALDLIPPEDEPSDRVDPVAVTALHRLLRVHRRQSGLPTSIDLRAFDRIEVCGPEGPARSLARAMICSAAAFHSPDDLVIAVLTSERFLAHWDWIKWLPHAQSARQSDAIGARRMVSTSLDQLAELLPSDLLRAPIFEPGERTTPPHILVVLDGAELPPGNQLVPPGGGRGVTVLDLPAQWDELEDASRLRLEFEPVADTAEPADGRYPVRVLRVRDEPTTASVDQCSLAVAEALARRLTPLHTVRDVVERADAAVAGTADFVELLGLEGVRHFDPDRGWLPRPARDVLRVPIGTDDAGAVVHLDLKESAQQGMGPHGLVIGATGSGKSEFLRTLVLGLAMTHSPEQLNLVLVDFKGGATFAGMAPLPHVSAVITNLAQELTLVDRMEDALSGELVRRQELLREAGNFASIHDYERARAAGRELPALPSLVVVVDEFSELLAAKPEFIELFVAIGRLGRSLGLHLLLASQRLDEGRLRGLESHLSYRVGLRTFSAHESRAVLGVPDAYELPPVPGLAYLKPDPATLVRFTTAYVSGPSSGPERVRRDAGQLPGIAPFTISEVSRLAVEVAHGEPEPVATPDQRSVLELGVEQLIGHGPPAHPIWLPPLDVPDTIDQLLPDLAVDPQLGLVSCEWRARGLVVPLGTLDRPREQRRDTFSVDLGGDAGHFAVVGGPRSGKSTVLRSLVAGLALTTTPTETQLFVLDLGGGLTTLAGLPHVAGVATRTEPEVLSRIVAEAAGIIDRREAYFRAHGIDSIETYRSQRAQGRVDDGYGEVFLVVDGWSVLRAEFDDAERELQQLSTRGLALGLHIVATAGRWTDFRAAMRDQFGSRLELRLGDPL
ncbi:MAG TPA: type VII secretion protein EccCa, partial [Nocardioides sp.]|nr:type VII secretion protein EccCa [Nocardioides sp.]